MRLAALAGGGGLARGTRKRRCRSTGLCAGAAATALARRREILALAAAGAAFLAAACFLIHGCPCAARGFPAPDAAPHVTSLDVSGLALLLVRVFRFASTGHGGPPWLPLRGKLFGVR